MKTRKPMIVAFMDESNEKNREESLYLKNILLNLLPKYRAETNILYVDDHQFSKNAIGIEWVEYPGLAILTIDNRIYPYPDDRIYEASHITAWIDEVFTGQIKSFPSDGDPLMTDLELRETMLNETVHAHLLSFRKEIYSVENDVILMMYNSARMSQL